MTGPIDLGKVDEALKYPRCAEFLNGVLDELGRLFGRGRGKTFAELFQEARSGIHGDPNSKYRGDAGMALIGESGLDIRIRAAVRSDYDAVAESTMHEVVHDSPSKRPQYLNMTITKWRSLHGMLGALWGFWTI